MPQNNFIHLSGNLADDPYFEMLRGEKGKTRYVRFDLVRRQVTTEFGQMKLQRFLNWVLAVTVFASLAGAWVFGYKLVSDLPGEFIPAGALPREALATSKLGRTTAEVVARLDRFVVAARDGRFWATVLRDVGEALLRFSIAQLHKLADIRRDTPSFSAPATSFSESGLGGSPPLATPTQRSSPAADCFDYAAAQEIVQLTNEKRVQAGLPALAIDAALMAMARK